MVLGRILEERHMVHDNLAIACISILELMLASVTMCNDDISN